MRQAHITHGYRQTGFTLIEIMITVVISLIMLIGVLNIFLAGKKSYNLQTGMSRLQENARYAFEIMSASIVRAAAFNPNINASAANTGISATIINPLGDATADGGGTASDTISVQYQRAQDCLGNSTAGNIQPNVAVDTFTITGGSLTCNGTAVVDGIDNMQILYGVDLVKFPGTTVDGLSLLHHPDVATDQDGIADTYVPFSTDVPKTNNDADKGSVVAVRIAILVNGVADATATMNSAQAKNNNIYTLLDAPALPKFGDRLIRRVFTRTVLIRNSLVRPLSPRY